jgi:hypothetical protein
MINKLTKLLSISVAVLAKRPEVIGGTVALKTSNTSTAIDIPSTKESIHSMCINPSWIEVILAETKPVCRRGAIISTETQIALAELAQKYKSIKPIIHLVDSVYQELEQQEKAIKALNRAKTTVELEKSIKILVKEQTKLHIAREILNKAIIEYNKNHEAVKKENTNILEVTVYPKEKTAEQFNILRDVIVIGGYLYVLVQLLLIKNQERLAQIALDNDPAPDNNLFDPQEFDMEVDDNPVAEPDGFVQQEVRTRSRQIKLKMDEICNYSTDDADFSIIGR